MISVRRAVAVCGQATGPYTRHAAIAVASSLLTLSTLAQAQEAVQVEEVTVTGSRIRQSSDYVSPNPISTVNNEFMQNLGIVNVADAVAQMPANVSSFQPTATGNGSFFVGSTITNLRGLNPYFGTRTLTLIDTRRHVPTNQGGSVDMNFIPSVLIERMETVTGGGSAAYGSEAIAGVVNVIMNTRLDGFKFEADYGETGAGDGADYHTGLAFGTDLFGGRAHLVVGGEYHKMEAIKNCAEARDWCRDSWGIATNNTGAPGTPASPGNPATWVPADDGLPQYIVTPNLRFSQINGNGVIWNRGLQVNADGTGVLPFDQGLLGNQFQAPGAIGGDGVSVYDGTALRPEVERYATFAHLDFALTDSIDAFIEGSYGRVEGTNWQRSLAANALCIQADNAFVNAQPDLQAAFLAAQGNGFPYCAGPTEVAFNKDLTDYANTYTATGTSVKRFALGANGPLAGTWTWDAYYQFGQTKRTQFLNDNRHLTRFNYAVDAVDDGSGNIVCRVTRDGSLDPLAAGCVPFNIFGNIAPSAGALDYAFGFLREDLKYEQNVVAGSVQGEVWEGFGAGPIQLALGAEYRREKGDNLAADEVPEAERKDYLVQFGDSFGGKVEVKEAFMEANVPLLRGVSGAELLEVNAAARHSNYTNTATLGPQKGAERDHDMTTWKVAAVWEPVNWLRLRGSQSHDLRAAGFRELYYSQYLAAGGAYGYVTNPWTNQLDPAAFDLRGNVDLKPEKADTTTVGFVLKPGGWAEGLQLAVDYYRIELKNGITPASVQLVLDSCVAGDAAACANILGTPDGSGGFSDVDAVIANAYNARNYKATGIDFTADYRLPVGPGTLLMRLMATRSLDIVVEPNATQSVDIAGQTGPTSGFLADWTSSPDWLANLVVSYAVGSFTGTVQARYTSGGMLDAFRVGPDDGRYQWMVDNNYSSPVWDATSPSTINRNRVPSHITFNLTGSYNFSIGSVQNLQVYGVINNVFDKDPPIAPTGVGGTNATFFDTLGRSYRVGVRMSF